MIFALNRLSDILFAAGKHLYFAVKVFHMLENIITKDKLLYTQITIYIFLFTSQKHNAPPFSELRRLRLKRKDHIILQIYIFFTRLRSVMQ